MEFPAGQRLVEKLVEDFYQPLYRYAFRLSGAAADAEDLVQEAFCRAQLCRAQLRDGSRAKGWLFQILRNVYLQRLRSERSRGDREFFDLESYPDETPEIARDIDGERLQNVLNELPEGFRTPLILYYFEDFSYRDIAEHMNVPMGTVMSRLARAKAHLRSRLASLERLGAGTGRREAADGL